MVKIQYIGGYYKAKIYKIPHYDFEKGKTYNLPKKITDYLTKYYSHDFELIQEKK